MPRPDWRAGRIIATIVAVCCIAVLTVYKVTLTAPKITPDSKVFLANADNLRLNACLSESEPTTGECVPGWGSQPPGYATFLATVRVATRDPRGAVALQVLIFAFAALVLALAMPHTAHWQVAVRTAIIVASPLTLAWGRWVLTETLAMAGTMCVFAFVCRAVYTKRVNVVGLALAVAFAMLMRWDQIWLLLPAVATIALVYPPRAAVARSLVVLAIAGAIPALLSARALYRGLPAFPTNSVDLDMPPGILDFWRTTSLDQRATTGLIWETWSRRHANVATLAVESISDGVPRADLAALITRVAALPEGTPLPADIDAEFGRLAERAEMERPLHTRLAIPAIRAARLWTWTDKQFYSGWEGVSHSAQQWEGWRTGYRIALVIACFMALLGVLGRPLRRIGALVLLYAGARTCFLVSAPMTLLETRYLAEMIPAMELVALLILERLTWSRARDETGTAPIVPDATVV